MRRHTVIFLVSLCALPGHVLANDADCGTLSFFNPDGGITQTTPASGVPAISPESGATSENRKAVTDNGCLLVTVEDINTLKYSYSMSYQVVDFHSHSVPSALTGMISSSTPTTTASITVPLVPMRKTTFAISYSVAAKTVPNKAEGFHAAMYDASGDIVKFSKCFNKELNSLKRLTNNQAIINQLQSDLKTMCDNTSNTPVDLDSDLINWKKVEETRQDWEDYVVRSGSSDKLSVVVAQLAAEYTQLQNSKALYEALLSQLKAINDLPKTLTTTVRGISNGDRVRIDLKVARADTGTSTQPSAIATDIIQDLPIVHRVVVDFAAGVAGTTLTPNNFYVDVSGKIQRGVTNSPNFGPAAFAHILYTNVLPSFVRENGDIFDLNLALSPGIASVSGQTTYLLGFSVLIAPSQKFRIYISRGWAWSQVTVLNGDMINAVPINGKSPTTANQLRRGMFNALTISFNF